jgi:hypothetical protein
MRLSLSHPPESRRLFVAGSVCWIIRGFDLREPLQAGGVDLGDPVLERSALDRILDLAIPQSTFKGDELPLLEGFGELREIAPGEDTMPFGAVLVFALVVLPAFLGCDVEDDVLFVVLRGFGFCVLPEAADENDFVEHGYLAPFLLVCPLSAVHACPTGVPSRPTPKATGRNLRKGTQTCFGAGVRTS